MIEETHKPMFGFDPIELAKPTIECLFLFLCIVIV